MINILFLGPFPPPFHGVSVADDMLLSSDNVKNYNIHVIDTAKGKSIGDIERIKFKNIKSAVYAFFQEMFILLFFKVDIVYLPISQNKKAFMRDSLYIKLAKIFKKKVIIHLHGGNLRNFYNKSSRLMQKYIFKTLKKINGAIVLGKSLKYIFQGIIPDSKIYVVENGINFKMQKTHNKNNEIKKILYLGNLIETKGVLNIVKAIPMVIGKNNNVLFTFVGEWQNDFFKSKVMDIVINNNLEKYVKFTGVLTGTDKEKEFFESDIFLFPTYYPEEGQPLVLIEAMAAGLPIITTDKGCISEMIIHNENGIIIEKNNVEEIAVSVAELINDIDLCRNFSINNIQKYKNYYTQEDFCNRFFKVIDDVNFSNKSVRNI